MNVWRGVWGTRLGRLIRFQPISVRHWRQDVLGGVITAIVSLPLALTFGVSSGLGAEAGLYGAIVVGLVAALFGGTPTLISEPTGPMTVLMTTVLGTMMASHPEQGVAMALTVVMLAGIFQIIFGVLKLGRYITLMPYSVISGFMSGIGVILIVLQLGPILGQRAPTGGVVGTLQALPQLVMQANLLEAVLAILTLAVLMFTPKRVLRYIPAQLLALLVGTLVSLLMVGAVIRRIGPLEVGLPTLTVPTFSGDMWRVILIDAVVLGMLGSIDTLLTAMIADSLTRSEHNSDKELVGQGLANFLSGLVGGLPGAGATMGTVVNIQTGARSALSGITRALLLLVVALGAARLTAMIPLAVLAAIALNVGLNILDWSFLRRAHTISKRASTVMYGVLVLTVFVDLIVAVAVGVFIANMFTIERLSKYQASQVRAINDADDEVPLSTVETRLLEAARGQVLLVYLSGPLIFGVSKAIAKQHSAIANCKVVVFDLNHVPMLDVTVSLAIENAIKDAVEADKQVLIVSSQNQIRSRLTRLGLFEILPKDALLTDRTDALTKACDLI